MSLKETLLASAGGVPLSGPLPALGPAKSIPEFCSNNGISIPMLHKLRREGLGPRCMKVGKRTLILPEAELEWRRAREQA